MKDIASPLFDIAGWCARIVAPACVIVAVLAGCASRAQTGPRDAASVPSSADSSAAAKPRFAQGGPDAEEYGASQGYPIGDRATCSRPAFLVGCHSHFDQILRVAWYAAPRRRRRWRGRLRNRQSATSIRAKHSRLTITSRATLPPGSSSPVAIRSSSNAISTRGTTGTASPRGRWPRRLPRCSSGSRSARATSARWTIPPPPTCPRSPTPSTGAHRCGICFRCPQASASSRSTRERTTSRGSPPTRFGRLVPAA